MRKPSRLNSADVPYDASVPDLLQAASKAGPAAWAALTALGHHDSNEAYDALRPLAASPDWRYRRAALEAMACHVRAGEARGLFCAGLEDESPYVVRTACDIVATRRITEAHAAVRGLLGSRDPATRDRAVITIGHLWAAEDFDTVHRLFRQDPSLNVRREAARTLRWRADGSTWRILFESWRDDKLHRHRVWACQIAGEFGDASVATELKALAEDRDGHVRKAATRALEQLEEHDPNTA